MYNVRTYDIRIYESVPHSYICYNAFDINQFCSIHGLIFNLFFFWYFIRILCVWLWTIWFDGRNVISDCHSRRSKTEQRDNFRFYFLFAGINCCECVAMHECQNVCTPQFQLLFLRHNFIFLYIFFYFVCVLFVCQFNESKRLEILFDHPFLISIYDRYNCGATSSISNLVSCRCYSTVALESNCCCCDQQCLGIAAAFRKQIHSPFTIVVVTPKTEFGNPYRAKRWQRANEREREKSDKNSFYEWTAKKTWLATDALQSSEFNKNVVSLIYSSFFVLYFSLLRYDLRLMLLCNGSSYCVALLISYHTCRA